MKNMNLQELEALKVTVDKLMKKYDEYNNADTYSEESAELFDRVMDLVGDIQYLHYKGVYPTNR